MRTATTHPLDSFNAFGESSSVVMRIEPPPGGWVLDCLRMEAHDDLRVVVTDRKDRVCLDVNGSAFVDGLVAPARTPRGAFEIEITIEGSRWCGSIPSRIVCRWRRASWWRRLFG